MERDTGITIINCTNNKIYKVYSNSIETEAVFTKIEINNK